MPKRMDVALAARGVMLAFGLSLAACAGASMTGEGADLSDPLTGNEDMAGPKPDLAGRDLASAGDMASNGAGCNPANETLGAAGGPDVCAYGEICDDASSKCKAVAAASCHLIMGAPTWNKSAKMAPVIAKVSATLLATTDAATECAAGDPAALVTVDYYAPQNLTATTMANVFLPQVKFKKSVVAADPFFSGTFMRVMPAPNMKFGTFKVGINCGGAGGSVKTAGFYITDGGGRASNAVCVSW